MQKIFIDTNIFLDMFLGEERKPHSLFAKQLFDLCEYKELQGYTSAVNIVNTYYILTAAYELPRISAIKSIQKILSIISIIETNRADLLQSANSNFQDFEDAVQYFTALKGSIDVIITRNKKDFKHSTIPVMTPQEFLGKYFA